MDSVKCRDCNTQGVKLWRPYGMFYDPDSLLCVDCALRDQDVSGTVDHRGLRTNKRGYLTTEIGWYVPCAFSPSGDPWGSTSIPDEDFKQWQRLPLRHKTDRRLLGLLWDGECQ